MLPIFEACSLIYTTPHRWWTRFFVDVVVCNKVVKVVHFVIVDVVLRRSVIASNHQHVQCCHCQLVLSPSSFVNFCHFVQLNVVASTNVSFLRFWNLDLFTQMSFPTLFVPFLYHLFLFKSFLFVKSVLTFPSFSVSL